MLILLNIYNISILHEKMNFQNNIFAAYGGAPVPVQERHCAAWFIFAKTPRSAGYRQDFPTIIISKAFRKRTGQTPAKFRNGR